MEAITAPAPMKKLLHRITDWPLLCGQLIADQGAETAPLTTLIDASRNPQQAGSYPQCRRVRHP